MIEHELNDDLIIIAKNILISQTISDISFYY